MVREGLRLLLERLDGVRVVAEAADGREAVRLAQEHLPDIVVMDVGLPELNGIEATRRLLGAQPDVKIVALSVHSNKRYVTEMLKAGAAAYLLKNCASEELLRAIEAVMQDQVFLSPGITAAVVEQLMRNTAQDSAFSVLSTREREVLQLLAEGKTSRQIAEQLKIAVRTIETHRREIMRKLDIRSVAELTKYAIREGLTSLES